LANKVWSTGHINIKGSAGSRWEEFQFQRLHSKSHGIVRDRYIVFGTDVTI